MTGSGFSPAPMESLAAYVSLGSNAHGGADILRRAVGSIGFINGIRLLSSSSVYLTEPQEYRDQPWFYNMALKIEVRAPLRADGLLLQLLALEKALGRKRDPQKRYGPRKIDLDLLLYGNEISRSTHCAVPHPALHKRAFVLIPLLEIEPEIRIMGKPAKDYLAALDFWRDGHMIYQHGWDTPSG